MAAAYSEDVLNIYSIYRATYPITNYDAAEEEGILLYIDRKLKDLIVAPVNPNLDKVIAAYLSNQAAGNEAIKGKLPGASGETNRGVFAFFRTAMANIWEGFWHNMSNFISIQADKAAKNLREADKKSYDSLIKGFVDSGMISQESADFLISTLANNALSSGLVPTFVILSFVIAIVFQMPGIAMGDFIKKMKSKFTPEQLDVGSLIKALHIAPELADTINQKIAETGLDSGDIKLAKIANYQTLDPIMIRDALWRKLLTPAEAVNRLEELGYTPKRIQEIMGTWELIPSPQDLLWMVGKEAFEQDQISKYGLDLEFPTEQVEWLEKMGLSQFWSKKYWAAHWNYPGEERVLDLMHRGLIPESDMDAFYRVIEMPKYWREKLLQASYSIYTRIDLRRLHDLKLITSEDVFNNFRAEGYDKEKAAKMTEFYIKYNELNDKDLSLSQIKSAYEADLITKSQALKALTDMGYTQDQSDFIIKYVEYEEDIKIQKLRIKSIAKMYKDGHYDAPKTRSMLSALGVEAKWVEVYLTQWNEEAIQSEKLPDKAEILQWYTQKVISFDDFVYYLRRMGYSDKTISIYATVSAPAK